MSWALNVVIFTMGWLSAGLLVARFIGFGMRGKKRNRRRGNLPPPSAKCQRFTGEFVGRNT